MNIYKGNLLHHSRAIHQALARFGADAKLDLGTMVLEVRARNRYYALYPQFICRLGGRMAYSRKLVDEARGFNGWLPYVTKRWPAGSGKLAFKDFCLRNGLRTPQMWRAASPELRNFVVKQDDSSFGSALRGPFKALDTSNAAQALAADKGYYEAFVRGRIVKAFYWEDKLACVEVLDMPALAGDGRSTLKELMQRKLRAGMPQDEWPVLGEVAAFQDLTLDTILAKGRSVLMDFRYGSYATKINFENENSLKRIEGTPLHKQLADIGPAIWRDIPEDIRPATLYTVDAIADEQDQAWLLELNCNPVCHPDVYSFMFETLFGAPKAAVEPAAVAAQPSPLTHVKPQEASTGRAFAPH